MSVSESDSDSNTSSSSLSVMGRTNEYHGISLAERIRLALETYDIPDYMLEEVHVLREYDIILLGDDSTSMRHLTDLNIRRFDELKNSARSIVKIGARLDEDGMDIYFLNDARAFENVTDPNSVDNIFDDVELSTGTPLGSRLEAVMKKKTSKPKLIIIATDGSPLERGMDSNASQQYFENVLRDRDAVNNRICILLCTDNVSTVRYYTYLDEHIPYLCMIDDFDTEKLKIRHHQGDDFRYNRGMHELRFLLAPVIDVYDKMNEQKLYFDSGLRLMTPAEADKADILYDQNGSPYFFDRYGELIPRRDMHRIVDAYDRQGRVRYFDEDHNLLSLNAAEHADTAYRYSYNGTQVGGCRCTIL